MPDPSVAQRRNVALADIETPIKPPITIEKRHCTGPSIYALIRVQVEAYLNQQRGPSSNCQSK